MKLVTKVLSLCFLLLQTAYVCAHSSTDINDSIDAMLSSRFKADHPGVVGLVTKDGKTIFRRAYGLANLELSVPVKPTDVFRIGSISKMFTGTALMMLVDEGKVALDAPLSTYLTDTPKHWSNVTIEHLLTHTSGIPDYTQVSGFWRSTARLDHSLQELISSVTDKPLDFEPGTDFSYDNTGFILLGMVIEKVSGKDFYDFLNTRIFTPLGLKHTSPGDDRVLIPGLVSGYQQGPKQGMYIASNNLHAAGGLVSNADDLATFMMALQSGRLVKPESMKRMNTRHTLKNGKTTEYGLAQWIRTVNGHTLVGHGGFIPTGFYSQLEMDLNAKIIAITLHNGDKFGGDNEYLSKRIIAAAQGMPFHEPEEVKLPANQFQKLLGLYGSANSPLSIIYEHGSLIYQTTNGKRRTLLPSSDTTFFVPGKEFRIRFILEKNQIAGLQVYEEGGEFEPLAKRIQN